MPPKQRELSINVHGVTHWTHTADEIIIRLSYLQRHWPNVIKSYTTQAYYIPIPCADLQRLFVRILHMCCVTSAVDTRCCNHCSKCVWPQACFPQTTAGGSAENFQLAARSGVLTHVSDRNPAVCLILTF